MVLEVLPVLATKIMFPLLFLDDLGNDMILVLKVFVLLTIISYVLQHLGKGPLAILLIAVISYFVIFDYFYIFGGIYVLYMLAVFGGVQIMVDFFFAAPHALSMGQEQQGGEGAEAHMSGHEFRERQKHMMHLRRMGPG